VGNVKRAQPGQELTFFKILFYLSLIPFPVLGLFGCLGLMILAITLPINGLIALGQIINQEPISVEFPILPIGWWGIAYLGYLGILYLVAKPNIGG